MVIVLALAAAVLYGSADFLGGAASRRTQALSVLTVSAPAGAVVTLAAALLAGGTLGPGLGWAAAGGAIGGAGLIAFYAGLAAGPMTVVAPVSALVSTVLPVGVALVSGERLTARVYAGVLLCLLAIVLVSMERPAKRQPADPAARAAAGWRGASLYQAHRATVRGVGYGVVSGLAFGTFFVFLRVAGESAVFWPVFASRLAGCVVALGVAAVLGSPPVWRGASNRVVIAAFGSGVLDAGANVFYVLATRAGLFGIAVVLTSLYPGVTVLLARAVLGEHMRRVQLAGLLVAATGVALVTF
jgi:drug/metabolite transporter (DMT)-like permease